MNNPHKFSAAMSISEEMIAVIEGFPRRGEYKIVPLTDEDRAAHQRAVAAIAELDSNPWVHHGYDGYEIEPLVEREDFEPSETVEEWLSRWRASKEQKQ